MLGNLTPEKGENNFLVSATKVEDAINSIPVIWLPALKIKIDKTIDDMLVSAAMYLFGKRKESVIAETLKVKNLFNSMVKSQAAGSEMRRVLSTEIKRIKTMVAIPENKLPAISDKIKPQVQEIIKKTDVVKAKEAATALTPEEAKTGRKMMWAGIATAIGAGVYLYKKSRK